MNLRQIEVFRAVMQAGSVTGAASLLHVSQPGVSRMLAHIELQLGLPLFQRIKGKLRPTPQAQTLFAQVEQVYSGVHRIEDCARELKSGGGLSLRVLSSPSLSLELVPQAIAQTASAFADAKFYLESLPVREMVAQLASGQADVGLSSLAVDHATLQATPIGAWQLSCAFPSSHPFAKRRTIAPRDILQERLISFGPDTPQGRAVAQWCEQTGLQPKSRVEVRSGQAACALVALDAGVAVVDSLTARAWRGQGLSFRPVESGPSFPIFVLSNTTIASSMLVSTFVEHLRQGLAQLAKP